ncbi:hypothetical protein BX666DRAFT_1930392 [Dichotomocladium elegans]|nr:hypothetical protein BX666DRAFT_1930392 [Dichotomocladium elegans]
MNINISSASQEKLRTFSPLILFHDHQFIKEETGTPEQTCTLGRERLHAQLIEARKKRIHHMLEENGRFWADIRAYSSTSDRDSCGSRRSSINSGSYNIKASPLNTEPLYSRAAGLSAASSRARYYVHPYRRHPPSHSQSYNHHHCQTTNDHSAQPNSSRNCATEKLTIPSSGVPDNASTSSASLPPSPISPELSPKDLSKGSHLHGPTKRRRGNLPKHVTATLRDWLAHHKKHPYPTEEEKTALAAQTNLTLNQISNWFINARRRILQPMIIKEQQERALGHMKNDDDDGENQLNGLDILPYIGDSHRSGSPSQTHRKAHQLAASSKYVPVARRRAALNRR